MVLETMVIILMRLHNTLLPKDVTGTTVTQSSRSHSTPYLEMETLVVFKLPEK